MFTFLRNHWTIKRDEETRVFRFCNDLDNLSSLKLDVILGLWSCCHSTGCWRSPIVIAAYGCHRILPLDCKPPYFSSAHFFKNLFRIHFRKILILKEEMWLWLFLKSFLWAVCFGSRKSLELVNYIITFIVFVELSITLFICILSNNDCYFYFEIYIYWASKTICPNRLFHLLWFIS